MLFTAPKFRCNQGMNTLNAEYTTANKLRTVQAHIISHYIFRCQAHLHSNYAAAAFL